MHVLAGEDKLPKLLLNIGDGTHHNFNTSDSTIELLQSFTSNDLIANIFGDVTIFNLIDSSLH